MWLSIYQNTIQSFFPTSNIPGYLQKPWRCCPSSTPRAGRTRPQVSRRPAAAGCSPCSPPGVHCTVLPGACLARLRRGCRTAAPRPVAARHLGHAAALSEEEGRKKKTDMNVYNSDGKKHSLPTFSQTPHWFDFVLGSKLKCLLSST